MSCLSKKRHSILAGNPNAVQDFNLLWIQEFKKTNAFEVWNRITDSMLFDIVEPRSAALMACGGLLTNGIADIPAENVPLWSLTSVYD